MDTAKGERMSQVKTFGKQKVELEKDTGFLILTQVGEINVEEARGIAHAVIEWSPPGQTIFMLANTSEGTGMTPEARAAFGEIGAEDRALYVANYGSSFQMRVAANLMMTANRLLGKKTVGTFEKEEGAARAWLMEHKAKAATP